MLADIEGSERILARTHGLRVNCDASSSSRLNLSVAGRVREDKTKGCYVPTCFMGRVGCGMASRG